MAIEYRTGHAFSRGERTAIQSVADRAARDVRALLPGLPKDGAWTTELLALGPGAPLDEWMYAHPDGRRWVGFKVGAYLADRSVRESGRSLAQLAGEPTEKILAFAKVR